MAEGPAEDGSAIAEGPAEDSSAGAPNVKKRNRRGWLCNAGRVSQTKRRTAEDGSAMAEGPAEDGSAIAEGPAEDGSAMEWGGASGRRTRRGWLCNGGRVGGKKKKRQRIALQWRARRQR